VTPKEVAVVAREHWTYDADSLRRALAEFEHAYGLTSDEFYALYETGGELPSELRRFERHVWASFVDDVRRLEGDRPIERVRRTFAHA
jgi:hypothetical protein